MDEPPPFRTRRRFDYDRRLLPNPYLARMEPEELEDPRIAARLFTGRTIGYPAWNLWGFSFGSRVGMEVGIEDPRVVRLISIGTPVDKYDFSFLRSCRKPILFVHGDHDEFGSVPRLRALVESLPPEAHARLEVIDDADHFFEDRLEEMKRVITEWMNEMEISRQ